MVRTLRVRLVSVATDEPTVSLQRSLATLPAGALRREVPKMCVAVVDGDAQMQGDEPVHININWRPSLLHDFFEIHDI